MREAQKNLKDIPEGFLKEGKDMADYLISRFKKSIPYGADALLQFKAFLTNSRPAKTPHIDKDVLLQIIRNCHSYRKPIDRIYETAYEEYRKTMEQINGSREKLKKNAGLKDILSGHMPHTAGSILSAYTKEIEKLRSFLEEKDVLTIPKGQKIIVRRTPEFMEPVRASASYSSPQPGTEKPAFFYITKDTTVHSEYIFLSAHETYPGHHLLDSARKTIRNPVLRAVESPLFYEGWASYAEELIIELGYIRDPVNELAGLRRRAWRAVRALADTGIPLGRITRAECAGYLLRLGYKKDAIDVQLKHYALTPGYQLCYTIGKYEIKRIRKHFMQHPGIKAFHDMLLYGGELPFCIIEEKMKNMPPRPPLYPHCRVREDRTGLI